MHRTAYGAVQVDISRTAYGNGQVAVSPTTSATALREIAALAALARGDVNVTLSEAKGLPPPNLRNGPAGDRHARYARSR
ncbi:MAG: hypothetical protein ACK4SN_13355 [Bellilinea sp.]